MEALITQAQDRGLPLELAHLILNAQGSQYLEALAVASFDTRLTDILLPPHNHLIAEIAQRWIQRAHAGTLVDEIIVISCFAKILPLATHLQPTIKQFLTTSRVFEEITNPVATALRNNEYLQVLLLALFRLLSQDSTAFTDVVKPVFLCSFFSHDRSHVRYLAIECFCRVMGFADGFCQRLIEEHIGTGEVMGPWEDQEIDYRLFKLLEERRWRNLNTKIREHERQLSTKSNAEVARFQPADLSPLTTSIAGVLIPRQRLPGSQVSSFVHLPTALENLEAVARTLKESRPTLLIGSSGAGKTAVIREIAREVQALSSMITLHLNDQTDAKSLLGIYTSSESGGGFTWQPGVLTKAVQEGRWVLVEDIDRAPAEVLGLLRPLIENNQLFLPSRKEALRPRDGFRLFGTVRASGSSSINAGGRNALLANRRLWNMVEILPYSTEEISMLLQARFPKLNPFLTNIMSAHTRILQIYSSYPSFKAIQIRLPSIREVLKWCRRLSRRLPSALSTNGASPVVPETFLVDMLKDGMDCYAAHIDNEALYQVLADGMAESLNIAPTAANHALKQQNPIMQQHKTAVQVGRSLLPRLGVRRSKGAGASRFALTRRVRQNMEMIATATVAQEPVLLVGETGVGKTTMLQYIASSIDQDVTVVNLSNQSEASDLLGGLKPVTTRSLLVPLIDEFDSLFDDTFSANKNEKFRQSISKAFVKQRWQRLIGHWEEAVQLAQRSLSVTPKPEITDGQSAKRRKVDHSKYQALRDRWASFANNISQAKAQIQRGQQSQVFAFVESRLAQAVRNGSWLLLDEINLASSETLDSLLSLLHNGDDDVPYLLLTEAGSIERIDAHPSFRIFAAMNPATDTGKKDLPFAVRSQFTEIYVHAGDTDVNDLVEVVQAYLGAALDNDKKAAIDLAKSYLALKQLNTQHKLTDGAGDLPHFSLRSLTRCLQYVQQHGPSHGLRRAMYEGMQMSFFTALDIKSQQLALPAIEQHLASTTQARKALVAQKPRVPATDGQHIAFEHHLIPKGPLPSDVQSHYIITASVRRNLMNLARASSMRRFPVLLQGPTSAGKTSMVEYLAKFSGNKFVRINNHEHTDLQEYLGSYASNADGKLEYREGVLVEALRKGYWIVLDELNLAPSDVLEALNRLLDDNRELLIPESQEIVRPHPNFMLFATQNPAGLYGGRKRLSRAFRNRFMEIHVDDIPEDELEVILTERSQIAPSYCKLIVKIYKDLSLQRQSSRLFEARNSFATLRDLFRWASRSIENKEQLAYHGYMLLAERVRDSTEKEVVRTTIEQTLKVKIDDDVLYSSDQLPSVVLSDGKITWTRAMRRLFVLVTAALQNNEPVLLVGETGCGKTQVCQCIAEACGKQLNIYNAHSNTETGDLIGSQRPIRYKSELAKTIVQDLRNLGEQYTLQRTADRMDVDDLIAQFKAMDTSGLDQRSVEKIHSSIAAYQSLFLWSDGSLVRAMKEGSHFLLDEISLADDSVLERMNSLLEPGRSILLAEKGAENNFVVAETGFQFLATMNPGGDYGKRELSAALRNRLTEIWVPALSDGEDVIPILEARLDQVDKRLASVMVQFAHYFRTEIQGVNTKTLPLRTLLTWVDFITSNIALGIENAVVHGAAMAFIDSLGANPAGLSSNVGHDLVSARTKCLDKLSELLQVDVQAIYNALLSLELRLERLTLNSFSIPRSTTATDGNDLVFEAPTTLRNAMRITRALQTNRPLLLEGNPGVGKTAIVSALAKMCGRRLTRVNLSDQTDLMDLFGADAPAADEKFGSFIWRDGPLLKAMQSGDWVLLDEMNLASQSVLEGLNACLDHRQEVYIAELDKTFKCHPDFTLFATQNPHHQGGGRKGLPASFVNRFVVVYADPFTTNDLVLICKLKYPSLSEGVITKVVTTVDDLQQLSSQRPEFYDGGPWELNLRDLHRWLALCVGSEHLPASAYFNNIIAHRFRTPLAKERALELCQVLFGTVDQESLYPNLTKQWLQVGTSWQLRSLANQPVEAEHFLHTSRLSAAKSIMTALNRHWPIILAGASDSGKTSLIRTLAALSGSKLVEFSMNVDVDATDLIGGYEQYETYRDIKDLQGRLKATLHFLIYQLSSTSNDEDLAMVLSVYDQVQQSGIDAAQILDIIRPVVEHEELSYLWRSDDIVKQLQQLKDMTQNTSTKFVWNDGILVDALESGSWLVLDNANLCNPSVLDRLNSLLEPDGCLIISEQHSAGGEVRVVRPHPDFRIFLTMDPRYGELSRAMRNRSLEIFLDGQIDYSDEMRLPKYPVASSIVRLRPLISGPAERLDTPSTLEPWVENLSIRELTLAEHPQHDNALQGLKREAAIRLNSLVTTSRARELAGIIPSLIVQNADDQPFTILINQSLPKLFTSKHDARDSWRAMCWRHALTRLLRCQSRLAEINEREYEQGTKGLTWLERTAPAALRQSRQKQGSSIPAYAFLHALLQFTLEYANSHEINHLTYDALDALAVLLDDLMLFFSQTHIEHAQIGAYLQVAASYRSKVKALLPRFATMFDEVMGQLGSFRELEQFQSLQRMWPVWKGRESSSKAQLEARIEMEKLIQHFGALCPHLPHSKTDLAKVRLRLLEALQSVNEQPDVANPIGVLSDAVQEFSQQRMMNLHGQPHFASTFDKLFRKMWCKGMDTSTLEAQKWIIFGGSSLEGLILSQYTNNSTSRLLSQIGACSPVQTKCTHWEIVPPEELAMQSFTRQLSSVHEQPIGRMHYAVEELSELARAFSRNGSFLATDCLANLRAGGLQLIQKVLLAHKDFLGADGRNALVAGPVNDVKFGDLLQEAAKKAQEEGHQGLPQTLGQSFKHSVEMLAGASSYEECGQGLLGLTTATLSLLITKKAFDPAQYPMLVRQRHLRRIEEQTARISAWKFFQTQFCGQDTSFIIRMLEAGISEIGEAPAVSPVYRAEARFLEQLSGEISNLQRNVLSDSEAIEEIARRDAHGRFSNGPKLLEKIWKCVLRLESVHRAYDDLVQPIIGLLRIMALSIRMLIFSSQHDMAAAGQKHIFTHDGVANTRRDKRITESDVSSMRPAIDNYLLPVADVERLKMPQVWLYLKLLKLKLAIGSPQPTERAELVAHIASVISGPYELWNRQVDQDRETAEANSRYYSYRGGDDIDEVKEADVRTEFPSYEIDDADEDANGRSEEEMEDEDSEEQKIDVRKTAIELARYHRSLFVEENREELFRTYLRDRISTSDETHAGFGEDEILTLDTMPSTLLCIQDKLQAFSGAETKSLNIYTDSDISETQKLYRIADGAASRFAEIKAAWPDHAVPVEVERFLVEVMALKMSDPLAKLLTKAEKLLEIISRWQIIASREWSVANIVESLTNLIIHWRRLELGSWSRLLDVEDQKQQDDADSWYFIAYGAVLHKSLHNVQDAVESGTEESLLVFRQELAITLEEFLKTTTLGQYRSRLELLRVFASTIEAFGQYNLDQWSVKSKKEQKLQAKRQTQGQLTPGTGSIQKEEIPNGIDSASEDEDESHESDQSSNQEDDESDSDMNELNGGEDDFFDDEEPATEKLHIGTQLLKIRDLILNVVNHHARYEPQIRKTLLDSRAALEKGITEQIKLASWKDTNVTALKESARRSHFKLFKIVKKYRALLAQPVANFNAPHVPDTKMLAVSNLASIPVPSPADIATHIEVCQENVKDWNSRPDRLKNPLGATTTMRHVYTTTLPEFSSASELASYLEDIMSLAQELRKTTPSTLTDDNKTLIRDLKQRKRKLLADTMKDLAQMGVRRNLGTNELASQSSRAQIFANLPGSSTLSKSTTTVKIDEAFHELLDVLPLARDAAVKHSEELSGGEVTRGLGYLEGLLALSIRHRVQWCELRAKLERLSRVTNLLTSLHEPLYGNFVLAGDFEDTRLAPLRHRTAWLPTVLNVYAGIVDFQQRQGEIDLGSFSAKLREHSVLIQTKHEDLDSLPKWPTHVSISNDLEVAHHGFNMLEELRITIQSCASNEPELEYIVTQLQNWLSLDASTKNQEQNTQGYLPSFDKQSRDFLDTVFVALQRATEALRSLPSSTENRDWLVTSTDVYGRAAASLHLDVLHESFESLLDKLQFLDSVGLQPAMSILALASPIIQQFQTICRDIETRMADTHLHTTQLAVFLGKTFTTLAKEGFCGPSEASDDQEQSGKVEQGTGLGEGEAAEDISKDVADDEDLTDLAQQPGERDNKGDEMDKSKDAVDMGPDDLEGEMGSGDEQGSDDESGESAGDEEEDQEQNEETGSVDDLDPNAVDEKMWDDMQKEAEKEDKEMKSQKEQGQKTDDQAAKGEGEEQDAGDDVEANEGEDEDQDEGSDDEGQQKADGENLDPHLQEEQALELPEEMQLNGEEEKEDNISDADIDDLSDVDDSAQPDDKQEVDALPDEDKVDRENSPGNEEPTDQDEEDLPDGKADDDEVVEDQPGEDDDAKDEMHDAREDDEMGDMEDQENGESGMANTDQPDLNAQMDEHAPQGQNDTENAAQKSEPQQGKQSSAQEQAGASEGALEQGVGRQDEAYEKQKDALKKLADVLEKYHQRREIFTASEDRQQEQTEQDVDMADADFEHLDDDTDQNDLQALGTANQDVSQNVDRSQAIEDSNASAEDDLPMPEDAEKSSETQEETVIERFNRMEGERDEREERQHARNAVVPESAQERPRKENDNDTTMVNMDEDNDDEQLHDQPSLDHNRSFAIRSTTTSLADAQQLWSLTSNKTQSLSLMLTEQLRLILQPTTATKLRGDFRTGKRLNIRRIIPYIASGYKRDKIWMRRSVPSKRNYQVMLAVDDSKSMAESGADILALETLCMLSRSLSMLEVGELSILAFGSDYNTENYEPELTSNSAKAIKIAHPFSNPFSPNQSGPETFRNFTFSQTATNIHALLSESIKIFRDARLKSSAREASDLWQLQIVISDGHIGSDSDDRIRRLVRRAREEKIMCVFVVVDGGEESIVDLKEVVFEKQQVVGKGAGGGSGGGAGDGEVEEVMKTRRYLEGFPFQYYVVVREVRGLPGVLSRVLKGWFEGVVESG